MSPERIFSTPKKQKPTPAGVLVCGTRDGQAWIFTCIGHVYMTYEPVKNKNWQSGYAQGAICLNCDREVYPMDSAWWLEKPSAKYLRNAGKLLRERMDKMQYSYDLFRSTYKQMKEGKQK